MPVHTTDPIKNKENVENPEITTVESDEKDKNPPQPDSDGFQEVKSKKAIKERQKSIDEKPLTNKNPPLKLEKEPPKTDRKPINKPPNNAHPAFQLTQQQISSIPPLMATPVNPPAILPQTSNKMQFERERSRQSKLPPRLAKQKENSRLQKAQMQQMCDPGDLKAMGMYGVKENVSVVPVVNAWDKPLAQQLRGVAEQEAVLGIEGCKGLEQQAVPSQSNSPGNDKVGFFFFYWHAVNYYFFLEKHLFL